MEIKTYSKDDEEKLFDMLREEGAEWSSYWGEPTMKNYKKALASSIVFVAYEGGELCGYVRCRDDDGFGVYVYDLLVRKSRRGKSLGRRLLEQVCLRYPDDTVYVMSDADEYYEKQGYRREGSIFEVRVQKGDDNRG